MPGPIFYVTVGFWEGKQLYSNNGRVLKNHDLWEENLIMATW
jgi:hypothetical protein